MTTKIIVVNDGPYDVEVETVQTFGEETNRIYDTLESGKHKDILVYKEQYFKAREKLKEE